MTDQNEKSALAAPVQWIEDEAKSGDERDAEGAGEFTAEERKSLLSLASEWRGFMRTSLENDRKILRELDEHRLISQRHGREMGKVKTHITEYALRLADVKGIQANGLLGKRVLVAEDSAGMLQIAVALLERLGCNIDGVATRAQAERSVGRHKYDAALVDLHLPHSEDGVELCWRIKRLWPTTAIVIMSGLLEAPGLEAIGAYHIEKPFSFEELRDVMYRAMGHGPALADAETIPPAAPFEGSEEPTQASVQLPTTRPDRARAGDPHPPDQR